MKTTYVLHDFNTCGIFQIYNCYVIERRLHTVLPGTFPAMLLMCLSPWDTSPTTCRVGMPWCKHRWLHQALRVVLNWVLACWSGGCYYDKLLLSFLHSSSWVLLFFLLHPLISWLLDCLNIWHKELLNYYSNIDIMAYVVSLFSVGTCISLRENIIVAMCRMGSKQDMNINLENYYYWWKNFENHHHLSIFKI